MADLRWSPRADKSLLRIAVEIGRWSENAAFRFVDRVRDRTALLADHPRIGPRRDDLLSGARMLTEGAYLIFYRTVPDTPDGPIDYVQIIEVIDGRRDLRAALQDGRP